MVTTNGYYGYYRVPERQINLNNSHVAAKKAAVVAKKAEKALSEKAPAVLKEKDWLAELRFGNKPQKHTKIDSETIDDVLDITFEVAQQITGNNNLNLFDNSFVDNKKKKQGILVKRKNIEA